ncbi:MAG: hypothetical protein GXO67_08460 [Archaeoglobi archaeon]|nr:hypothetical protein [Archaeoglobi archaeon]
MRCGDCYYFIPDHGSAGMCSASSTDKVCAPGGCTGLPFKRVFAHDTACSHFRKKD